LAELTADLIVTLDGFAAGVDQGPFFGYGGPELDSWVRQQLETPHVVVMGRVTYEAMAQISAPATDEISVRMNALPKVVLSRSLSEPLAWANSRLLSGDTGTEIRQLKQESPHPLRAIGSLSLVRSLLALGLIDRFRLIVCPVVLGRAGLEPVYAGYPPVSFTLASSAVLDSRLVVLDYRPAAPSR
jgi:dihydrofolate reductase